VAEFPNTRAGGHAQIRNSAINRGRRGQALSVDKTRKGGEGCGRKQCGARTGKKRECDCGREAVHKPNPKEGDRPDHVGGHGTRPPGPAIRNRAEHGAKDHRRQ
jgi:uncharacterized low-complexity protein